MMTSRLFGRTCLIRTALVALGLILAVAVVPAADSAAGPDPIWQSIFARPAPSPVEPLEAKRQELGFSLFFDTRLSRDGDRSCATCHQPQNGYTDTLPRAVGRDGTALKRNTAHLFNLAWSTSFYWDGREPTLERQARQPLHAPNEMAVDLDRAIALLAGDAEKRAAFAAAFPEDVGITESSVLAALAAYEKTIVSPQTRFDAWIGGDSNALSDRERRGFRIFVGKGGCLSCHGGWRMTDDDFHDIGLATSDPGRSAVAGGTPGIPAFKTPGLRQVARTAPYMHDGSLATLEDVVAHYAGKHVDRPSLAPSLIRRLELDADERAALVAFLRTL
jgi:cytochrome c peroxidase